jgi:hypothetical protein
LWDVLDKKKARWVSGLCGLAKIIATGSQSPPSINLAGQQHLQSRCDTRQIGEWHVDLDKTLCEHGDYCFVITSACQTISIVWDKYNVSQERRTIPPAPLPQA